MDRLLRGAKVADLPVQFPTKFELIVNLKTAKAMEFAIPESFLLRGSQVDRITSRASLVRSTCRGYLPEVTCRGYLPRLPAEVTRGLHHHTF